MAEGSTMTENPGAADDCILDGGATAGLVGMNTLDAYRETLIVRGWPKADACIFYPCNKRFRFGDGNLGVATTCALVPSQIDDKAGKLMFYVIPVSTPFLIARPMMEAIGLTIQYGDQSLLFKSGRCIPAPRGRKGHYVLRIGNVDFADPPTFAIMPHEVAYAHNLRVTDRDDLYQAEDAYDDETDDDDELEKIQLQADQEQLLLGSLNAVIQEVDEKLAAIPPPPRPRIIWEVFAGEAATSEEAKRCGAKTRVFGLHTGWNFFDESHRNKFMKLLKKET